MMCGLSGIFSFSEPLQPAVMSQTLQCMMARMQLRGPDDSGTWVSPEGGVGFGFRRLAVLDTTPAGHQPMLSNGGRSVLMLNGEIYNFKELRRELESKVCSFRSRSDTEVLQTALETWGLDAIQRLNGMFAFAWYDIVARTLVLARDHAGIKPLYYAIQPSGKGVLFGSQYNQLLLSPWGLPGELQPEVLNLYLHLNHIPPPYGLLKNTYQLEPGHMLIIRDDGHVDNQTWWQLPRSPKISLSGGAAVEAAGIALENAVSRQLVADVPVGVFLSGGVDSPLITALSRQQTGSGLKAFTIGNPGWRQDESADAQRYAQHLDVNFQLHNASGEEMLDMLEDIWQAQYEPFADYSILPTMLVSRFARSQVTVALSGDGGDELFFGYERPLSLLKNGQDFRYPWLIRYGLYASGRLGLIPPRSEVIAAHTPGDYYYGVNSRMNENHLRQFAPDLKSLPPDFSLYKSGDYRGQTDLAHYSRWVEYYGQLQRGLKKMDMASMHNSLEVRVPMLDREVIETSLRIDPFTNMEDRKRKQVLVKLLARHVPAEIIPQSKRGFAIPLGDWLRGPLRPMVEDVLLSYDLYPSGLFKKDRLQAYWQEHLSGQKDHKWGLWSLLALQGWARVNL